MIIAIFTLPLVILSHSVQEPLSPPDTGTWLSVDGHGIGLNQPTIAIGVMNAATTTSGTKQLYLNGTMVGDEAYTVKGPA